SARDQVPGVRRENRPVGAGKIPARSIIVVDQPVGGQRSDAGQELRVIEARRLHADRCRDQSGERRCRGARGSEAVPRLRRQAAAVCVGAGQDVLRDTLTTQSSRANVSEELSSRVNEASRGIPFTTENSSAGTG